MNTYSQNHNRKRVPLQSLTNGRNQKFNIVDNRPSSIQMTKTIQSINLVPIQCYRQGTTYNTSTNGIYRTFIVDDNMLDIKKGTGKPPLIAPYLEPNGSVSGFERYKFKATPYDETTGEGNFVNDCGFFARFLMTGNKDALKGAALTHSKADPSQKLFRSITSTGAPNEMANPAIREAYFMGKDPSFRSTCRHHAAAVVAKDGGDNITCEANAAAEGAEAPIFDMYGTEDRSQTFYEKQKGNFGDETHPAFTQVLERE